MKFRKVHGAGNDFLLLSADSLRAPIDARALCDRRLGVGADGILIVGSDPPSMKVINADGSEATMCGNGLRCVASFLHAQGLTRPARGDDRGGDQERGAAITIETAAGPHRCLVYSATDVEVEMRSPSWEPAAVPLLADAPWREHQVPSIPLRFSALSVGNPHAVTFDPCPPAEREGIAEALRATGYFPEGVNVSFATLGQEAIELRVHERGVGWTAACGTAACATAAAAVALGRWPSDPLSKRGATEAARVPIAFEHGVVTVSLTRDRLGALHCRMRGPVAQVYEGEL